MHEWDAALFSRFEEERTLPTRDLCHAIPLESAARILEADVLPEVTKAYPFQQNGEIIFCFPRFFFTAVR